MTIMAKEDQRMISAREISQTLRASEAHLSKVLQRLSRAGLVKAVRGPKGGFILNRDPGQISLLEIYETIEGPLTSSTCLIGPPVCQGKNCILGGLIESVNRQVREYLSGTRLSELRETVNFNGGDKCQQGK